MRGYVIRSERERGTAPVYDDDISVQQLGVSKRTKEKKNCVFKLHRCCKLNMSFQLLMGVNVRVLQVE